MQREKFKYTKEFLLFNVLFVAYLLVFFTPGKWIYDRVMYSWGLPDTQYEDMDNLYPDSILEAYLVDNLNASHKDNPQFSIVVPFTMTNNYTDEDFYEMQVSLKKTHLHQSFNKKRERLYKSSHGRYHFSKRKLRYKINEADRTTNDPLLRSQLDFPGSYKNGLASFHYAYKKTCRFFNPSFFDVCNSRDPLSFDLQPGESSERYFFDFPIPHWNQNLLFIEDSSFELRVVQSNESSGHYSITIQEVIDCRLGTKNKDVRCESIPHLSVEQP